MTVVRLEQSNSIFRSIQLTKKFSQQPMPDRQTLSAEIKIEVAPISSGFDLLSGRRLLGSLALRYASIPRRRVCNAIVRDCRKRISSMRRSSCSSLTPSLSSATLLPGMFTVIDATLRLPLTVWRTVCNRYVFGERLKLFGQFRAALFNVNRALFNVMIVVVGSRVFR